MKFRFPTVAETIRAGYGLMLILRFDMRAAQYFGATAQAALAALSLYLFIIPLITLANWQSITWIHAFFGMTIPQSYAYYTIRLIIGILVSFQIAYLMARRLNATRYFTNYICAASWVDCAVTLVLILMLQLFPPTEEVSTQAIVQTFIVTMVNIITVMATLRLHLFQAALTTFIIIVAQQVSHLVISLIILSPHIPQEIINAAASSAA